MDEQKVVQNMVEETTTTVDENAAEDVTAVETSTPVATADDEAEVSVDNAATESTSADEEEPSTVEVEEGIQDSQDESDSTEDAKAGGESADETVIDSEPSVDIADTAEVEEAPAEDTDVEDAGAEEAEVVDTSAEDADVEEPTSTDDEVQDDAKEPADAGEPDKKDSTDTGSKKAAAGSKIKDGATSAPTKSIDSRLPSEYFALNGRRPFYVDKDGVLRPFLLFNRGFNDDGKPIAVHVEGFLVNNSIYHPASGDKKALLLCKVRVAKNPWDLLGETSDNTTISETNPVVDVSLVGMQATALSGLRKYTKVVFSGMVSRFTVRNENLNRGKEVVRVLAWDMFAISGPYSNGSYPSSYVTNYVRTVKSKDGQERKEHEGFLSGTIISNPVHGTSAQGLAYVQFKFALKCKASVAHAILNGEYDPKATYTGNNVIRVSFFSSRIGKMRNYFLRNNQLVLTASMSQRVLDDGHVFYSANVRNVSLLNAPFSLKGTNVLSHGKPPAKQEVDDTEVQEPATVDAGESVSDTGVSATEPVVATAEPDEVAAVEPVDEEEEETVVEVDGEETDEGEPIVVEEPEPAVEPEPTPAKSAPKQATAHKCTGRCIHQDTCPFFIAVD